MALGGFNFFNSINNNENENNFDNDIETNSFEDLSYYEETHLSKETLLDKIIKTLKNISTRQIIFLSFLGVVILSFLFILVVNINKNNKLYKAIIDIPDIVYVGESYNIKVKAYAKKDVENTITNFKSDDEKVLMFLNGSLKGNEVYDVLMPVQEGKTTIAVESKLGNRRLDKVEKEIVVCPKFDKSLIFSGKISIPVGNEYDLNFDFGEEVCGKGVTYESSNSKIMTVNDKGEIKGISTGTCNLIVKKEGMYFKVPVTVTKNYNSLKKINITKNNLQLVVSEKFKITGSFKPSNTSYQRLYFKDYNDDIIEVSDSGVITALKEGNTSIRIFDGNRNDEVYLNVNVYKPILKNGVEAESLKLSHSNIVMNAGKTEKITFAISPSNTRNKTIKWSSTDENIAIVKDGIIYAKSKGKTTIKAMTNNGIIKKVSVKVESLDIPVIIASDKTKSGNWHKNKYIINVTGSVYGADYYYGFDKDSVINDASNVLVSEDGIETYYFKACLGDDCSPVVSYLSKLDTTKPIIKNVTGIEEKKVDKDLIQIYLSDAGSLVSKWCVVSSDDHTLCTWKSIKAMATPVVTYTANRNGTFYVFAKDVVGNVSDAKSFTIKNIKE